MDTKKTEDMKFAKKKKKMSGKSRTFMLITIPIVALFFTFNTLPLIQGAIYSFTNFRGKYRVQYRRSLCRYRYRASVLL